MNKFDLIIYTGFGAVSIVLAALAIAPVAILWG